jgi:glycosyltransferase involved in cell wall biosynthesis
MACGTPVVASAVGGIPEQIRSVDASEVRNGTGSALDGATGMLVPAADAIAMANAVSALLTEEGARTQLGRNAVRDARSRFDLDRQVERYLEWYRTIIEHWNGHANPGWNRTPTSTDPQNTMALD